MFDGCRVPSRPQKPAPGLARAVTGLVAVAPTQSFGAWQK
jgi:hypothetical protein